MTVAADAAVTVAASRQRELIVDVFESLGAGPADAAAQARLLVEADLRGRPSHGLQRLPTLVGRVENGVLDPTAPRRAAWTTETVLRVDCGGGVGPAAGLEAIAAIGERARRTGIALAAVRNGSHVGMLAPYVEDAAEQGLIGIGLTTSEALVHPAGGTLPMVGTNPIAIGVPIGADRPPFVLDMATGATSMGQIIAHASRGEALAPGLAIDAAGEPTTDAARALEGAISPFGGGKGFGLGLAIELLVSLLTDTEVGSRVTGTLDTTEPSTKGDVFIAIDASHAPGGGAAARIAAYLDELRAAEPQPGTAGVAVPGDRARRERERRLRDGIAQPAELWREVEEIRQRLHDGAAPDSDREHGKPQGKPTGK